MHKTMRSINIYQHANCERGDEWRKRSMLSTAFHLNSLTINVLTQFQRHQVRTAVS